MKILRQKEFARFNYEGLTERGKRELKKERKKIAGSLKKGRKKVNDPKNYKDTTTLTIPDQDGYFWKGMEQPENLDVTRKLTGPKIKLPSGKKVASKTADNDLVSTAGGVYTVNGNTEYAGEIRSVKNMVKDVKRNLNDQMLKDSKETAKKVEERIRKKHSL